MSENLASEGQRNPLSLSALISGVVGFVVFFIGGPTLDLWPVGTVIGAVAVVLGLIAPKREPAGKRLARVGLILGGIVVVWFVVFIALAAAGVITDD